MLYEIIEKTNDWKLGDKWLTKGWLKQGYSEEKIRKVQVETRDLRGFEYNRGVTAAAIGFGVAFVVVPYVKWKINDIRTKRKLKKIQESITRNLEEEDEESEEEA